MRIVIQTLNGSKFFFVSHTDLPFNEVANAIMEKGFIVLRQDGIMHAIPTTAIEMLCEDED
jgi:hypothetical protein